MGTKIKMDPEIKLINDLYKLCKASKMDKRYVQRSMKYVSDRIDHEYWKDQPVSPNAAATVGARGFVLQNGSPVQVTPTDDDRDAAHG